MPKIEYEHKNFSDKTIITIQQAENIVNEYSAQGFNLTLRQLYYQLVARGLIPNTERDYKRIGNIVSDARRAGIIDWNSIEDRTRYIRELSSWDTPKAILRSAMNSYHRDLWSNQVVRMEVWIEKDALVGVIEDICQEHDVPFFSCRGYVSDSEMWRGAIRMQNYDKRVIILHLGDHDPSGIDMTRDIRERLALFSDYSDIEVRRIALTMEQVEEINPPPNPAKVTDSRYESYVYEYGEESWELDALEPQYIVNLIENEILLEKDEELWEEAVFEQENERGQIEAVINKWDDIFSS